ncbi:MAG TPA: hypothetical protein VIL30_26400 [Ramlibacter sp.]|jgi:hypothetical protein
MTKRTQPSLAARMHALVGPTGSTSAQYDLTPEDQRQLFGIAFPAYNTAIIDLKPDSTFSIGLYALGTNPGLAALYSLSDIQQMVEDQHDREMGYDSSGFDYEFSVDLHRTFPRDKSAFLTIENKALGRKETTVDVSLQNAKDNFAVRHGYADWSELRALAPAGDRDEDWTVEWTDGDPEEYRRRQIVRLEAEQDDLVAKLRDEHQEELAQAFLNKQAKLLDFALKRGDPEAYSDLEVDCSILRERHLAAFEENRLAFARWKDVCWLLKMYGHPDVVAA